jgi:hypothetical protein
LKGEARRTKEIELWIAGDMLGPKDKSSSSCIRRMSYRSRHASLLSFSV